MKLGMHVLDMAGGGNSGDDGCTSSGERNSSHDVRISSFLLINLCPGITGVWVLSRWLGLFVTLRFVGEKNARVNEWTR